MKLILIGICLSCYFTTANAQESVNTGGGDISGAGGIIHYSVGQINYAVPDGKKGSTSEGVQQPFDFVPLDINTSSVMYLSMGIYPNPTKAYIILNIDEYNVSDLYYNLYDNMGHLLFTDKINNATTQIPMAAYPAATYLLSVYQKNKRACTFNIIKNN